MGLWEDSIGFTKKEKPPRSCRSQGAFHLVGLTVLVESVKPLADIMWNYICHGRLQDCENMDHWFHLPSQVRWAGWTAEPVYHKLRQKDTINAKRRVLVNFLHSAWLLRGMAYDKSTKDRSNVVHCSHQSERKPPPGVPAPKGGLLYLVLTAREPSVKPLANVIRRYICSDRQNKR